eukprot:TRINITY_DN21928_c0_g1_i1.p1 TRINITY_DN21928_c0_g1~~TRINITY_DN21928_c0_g1_i1.p1  ORF type:complete len:190 (+),score=24.43 TRINITY_DN21928_c0_g1_i1:68-571(+)
MFREIMFAQYMGHMSQGVGLTCDMGKDGRSELTIGNGWVEHERPDGKRFFVNPESGKRTWTRPSDALPEQHFDRCLPFVQKMKYEGRYPVGIVTTTADGYDCQSFLERLYDINEQRWTNENVSKAAAERSSNPDLVNNTASEMVAPIPQDEDDHNRWIPKPVSSPPH